MMPVEVLEQLPLLGDHLEAASCAELGGLPVAGERQLAFHTLEGRVQAESALYCRIRPFLIHRVSQLLNLYD